MLGAADSVASAGPSCTLPGSSVARHPSHRRHARCHLWPHACRCSAKYTGCEHRAQRGVPLTAELGAVAACARAGGGAGAAAGTALSARRCAERDGAMVGCCDSAAAAWAVAAVSIRGRRGTAVPNAPPPVPRCVRWHALQNGCASCSRSDTLSSRRSHTMQRRHCRWYGVDAGPSTFSAAYTRSAQRGHRGAAPNCCIR